MILGSASFSYAYVTGTAVLIVVGLVGNGLITIANGFNWIRSNMSAMDMILTALNLSRLLFLGTTLAIHCVFLFDVDHPKPVPNPIMFLWSFSNAITMWMATCLAVFYCIRVINVAQLFFVKIKLRLPRMVPQLLLGSVLISLVSSLPFILLEHCFHCCNGTKVLLENSGGTCLAWTPNYLISISIYNVGIFLSFIIFLVSCSLLIHSLVQHVKKMKQNSDSFRDQKMDVHVKAIKNLVSFLILYSAGIAAEISLTLFTRPWTIVTSIVVVATYHAGHTIILIVTNSKLKQEFKFLGDTVSHCLGKIRSSRKTLEEMCPS